MAEKETPRINVRFLFNFCNDLKAVRRFYTDLIGLEEISFRTDEEWGWLVYKNEGFQFIWFRSDGDLPVLTEWAAQPGYEGGDFEGTS